MNDKAPHDWSYIKAFLCKISQAEGCLLWTGRINQSSHYGQLDIAGPTTMVAHRFAWEIAHNKRVPDGYTVDHVCHVTLCVNPTHLEIKPPGQNLPRSRSQLARAFWIPEQFAHAVPQGCGLPIGKPAWDQLAFWNGNGP